MQTEHSPLTSRSPIFSLARVPCLLRSSSMDDHREVLLHRRFFLLAAPVELAVGLHLSQLTSRSLSFVWRCYVIKPSSLATGDACCMTRPLLPTADHASARRCHGWPLQSHDALPWLSAFPPLAEARPPSVLLVLCLVPVESKKRRVEDDNRNF
jgi:hypothetical protein